MTDDFHHGHDKLWGSKLKKWITDTTRYQGLRLNLPTPVDVEAEGDQEDMEDTAEEENEPNPPTWGYTEVINGELIFENGDILAMDVDEWLSQVEEENMGNENMEVDYLD